MDSQRLYRFALRVGALVCALGLGSLANAGYVTAPAGFVNVFRTASGATVYTAPGPVVSSLSGQPGTAIGATSRTLSSGMSGIVKGVNIAEAYGLEVGGEPVAVVASRFLPSTAVAAAAVQLGAAAWTGFQLGAPISKALGHDTLTLGDYKCTATNSGWQCGGEQAPTGGDTVSGWQIVGIPASNKPTKQEACSYYGPIKAAMASGSPQFDSAVDNGSTCYVTWHTTAPCCGGVPAGYVDHWTGNYTSTTTSNPTACPASIDALNPAWNVPAGTAPGADGMCPTGRYAGVQDSVITGLLSKNIDSVPSNAPALAQDTLAKGGAIQDEGKPASLSGPSSSPGPSTTTTTTPAPTQQNPNPAPVTVSNPTTNNYTYNTNVVTVTTTNTVYNADGSKTDTTKPPADDRSECDKSPDTLGCMKVGTIDDGDVPKSTQSVTWAAEDVALPSGCPAPIDIGGGQSLSYQSACDAMTKIKPIVVGLAMCLAASICLVSVQQQ